MKLLDIFRWSRKATAVSQTDIVVFIVGPSGSGKSWLLSLLLKMAKTRVPINKGQKPCTTKVYAERCHFEGMQNAIILVDTPSFYTYADPDGEKIVKKWIDSKNLKEPVSCTRITSRRTRAIQIWRSRGISVLFGVLSLKLLSPVPFASFQLSLLDPLYLPRG